MNLDDYTKELFEELGWQDNTDADSPNSAPGFNAKIDMHNSEGCEEDCSIDDFSLLSERFATQIAKEVQRREIKAKLDVMHWAMKGHSIDSEDYCKTMQREINQLEQQLKELEEV